MRPTYEELTHQLSVALADNSKAMESLKLADDAVKLAHDKFKVMAAEVFGVIAACEHVYAAGYKQGHLNTVDGIAGNKTEFYGLALEAMSANMETPATDAYLAEVRAQGVEMFAANEMEWAAHWEKHGVNDGSVSRCVMVAQDAEKFAAQLRQGSEHE